MFYTVMAAEPDVKDQMGRPVFVLWIIFYILAVRNCGFGRVKMFIYAHTFARPRLPSPSLVHVACLPANPKVWSPLAASVPQKKPELALRVRKL